MQCLDNLNKEDRNGDVAERMGKVLRQAGVSITVTSLTDIVAFAVGTTTVSVLMHNLTHMGINCSQIINVVIHVEQEYTKKNMKIFFQPFD